MFFAILLLLLEVFFLLLLFNNLCGNCTLLQLIYLLLPWRNDPEGGGGADLWYGNGHKEILKMNELHVHIFTFAKQIFISL